MKEAEGFMEKKIIRAFATLGMGVVFAATLCGTALAQGTQVSGTVTSSTGERLPGVTVQVRGTTTTTTTDANGRYVSDGLAAGVYRVTLVVNGAVKASINNTKTKADQPTQLNFDLKPAPAPQANAAAKTGKHKVWVPATTGSHIGGTWVEVDDSGSSAAGAENVQQINSQQLQRQIHSTTGPAPTP